MKRRRNFKISTSISIFFLPKTSLLFVELCPEFSGLELITKNPRNMMHHDWRGCSVNQVKRVWALHLDGLGKGAAGA